jgi:predicted ATPase with chaperone activity
MLNVLKTTPRTATRDRVREAFSHLVISQQVLDQLGPAVNAGHSMFVYGPPGNGKTVISQAIRKLLEGEIAIPHAIEVEGAIIRVFDPVNHEPIEAGDPQEESLDLGLRVDRRWVRCRRPMVMVGGELTLDALELSYNPSTGFYRAPVQAIANGGVLVIDDFGRQQVAPRDLLNRWIVPLESRVDFLTLQSGQKFEVPFMVLVIFATNIKPSDLVDEAFLRRIHYKVFAESPTVAEFMQIFENCCRDRGVTFDRTLVQNLLQDYYRPRKIPLRGCQPRDLIDQVLSLADYRGERRELTRELLEAACAGYFVDEREATVLYA